MFLEASGGCVNPPLMVWNLQEVAVNTFTYLYIEISVFFRKHIGALAESNILL